MVGQLSRFYTPIIDLFLAVLANVEVIVQDVT